jgi:hypothetical protein
MGVAGGTNCAEFESLAGLSLETAITRAVVSTLLVARNVTRSPCSSSISHLSSLRRGRRGDFRAAALRDPRMSRLCLSGTTGLGDRYRTSGSLSQGAHKTRRRKHTEHVVDVVTPAERKARACRRTRWGRPPADRDGIDAAKSPARSSLPPRRWRWADSSALQKVQQRVQRLLG